MQKKPKKRLTAQERRAQILEVARIVFFKKGMKEGRFSEIAALCNVDEALIYQHFKSKEALYLEAMKGLHDRQHVEWRELGNKAGNGLGELRELVMYWLRKTYETHANASGATQALMGSETSKRVLAYNEAVHRKIVDALEGAVRRGQDDGSIRSDLDHEAVAFLALSVRWGTLCEAMMGRKKNLPLTKVEEHLDMFLTMLKAPGTRSAANSRMGSKKIVGAPAGKLAKRS